jgi:hypothetical protein
MRRELEDLLALHLEVTERRRTVGDLTGTEFVLAGGGLLWIADGAPDWAVRRALSLGLREEVHEGFGDRWRMLVHRPSGEVDL